MTLGAVWLTTRQNHDREIAADTQQEFALQSYIDKMSELLLDRHLGELKPEYEEVRNIARVRTLTVLPQLNPQRKRSIIRFLQESGLINNDNTIVKLTYADLTEADLYSAYLAKTNLIHTYLERADLENAGLIEANLSQAKLVKANLTKADLSKANLTGTNLSNADLTGANLSGANLSEANLEGVNGITVEEFEQQAKSLKGAAMPDGSIHP